MTHDGSAMTCVPLPVVDLGRRARRLHGRRHAAHVVRRRRARRRGALRRLARRAVRVRGAAAAGLREPAGACGVLLDRFGARTLVVVGALVMAAGQLLLALADGLPLAIAARVLVGAGDALTFISVLAVVVAWFPARRVPVMTQLTGLIGQLGQVLSAIPFAALLHGPGWATAFGSARRSAWPSRWRCSRCCATGRPARPPRRPRRRRARCCRASSTPGGSPAPGWASGRTPARSSPARCSRCSGACPTWWPGRA